MKEAFGKFEVGKPPVLRSFEVKFRINSRKGQAAWRSDDISIQRLLDHLYRYTKSESSREKYLRHVAQFSDWSGSDVNQLISLPKKSIEILVQRFVDELANKDHSRAYVNTVIKRLRTFFRVNGYIKNRELNIKGYFVPTRYRKIPEYIPTKAEIYSMADAAGSLRDRAIILSLWSSGVRVSTLCALDYRDVLTELENDEPHVMIPIYPEMKTRVADACKGLIAYYTFISAQAGNSLRNYIREREEGSKLGRQDALFCSNWNLWLSEERSRKRIGRRGIELIVKKSAKLGGILQWKHVTPHCLRKSFKSILRSNTKDGGRLDSGTQEFLMGHILSGTQDAYYDKTKVDFHRDEYAKLDFSISRISRKITDKLIDIPELEKYLSDGWLFVAKVSESKSIVRRSD